MQANTGSSTHASEVIDDAVVADEREFAAEHVSARSRRGPTRWQVAAFVVGVCFLSGVIGWWIATPSKESFNSVDVGFLSDMQTHHGGAIGIGFAYLGRGNDSLVGHFAREIILTQSQEISVMNSYLNQAGSPSSTSDDVAMDWMGMGVPPAQMPGMATDQEMAQLRSSQGLDADDQFTRLMIRHHAAGVAMADYEVANGENGAVKRLAAAMARLQRSEIAEMNTRRTALGLPAVTRSELEQLEQPNSH